MRIETQNDSRGHHPTCPNYREELPPLADENTTHVDLFCDCHKNQNPLILANGTDIAWPAGWDEKQANKWREKNCLARNSAPDSGVGALNPWETANGNQQTDPRRPSERRGPRP
jgi:hypothetical protein